jgi:hypothetical protein
LQSKLRSGSARSHQDAARKSLVSDSGRTGIVTFNGSASLRAVLTWRRDVENAEKLKR